MAELVRGSTISEAWHATLKAVNAAPGGEMVHLLTSVSDPSADEDVGIRSALDAALARSRMQSVDTIANTIFPWHLYPDPQQSWSPHPGADNTIVVAAAQRLYDNYEFIFPRLREAHPENRKGIYFARMISWPGKPMGGFNQLEKRLEHLRSMNSYPHHKSAFNASDIAVADPQFDEPLTDHSVGIYRADDHRIRSFPCLVHVDIGVHENRLNLVGVYRHWYLIQKGYGNLLGLARLQRFLAQQSGYAVGELAVQATFATAEQGDGKRRVNELLQAHTQPELAL